MAPLGVSNGTMGRKVPLCNYNSGIYILKASKHSAFYRHKKLE